MRPQSLAGTALLEKRPPAPLPLRVGSDTKKRGARGSTAVARDGRCPQFSGLFLWPAIGPPKRSVLNGGPDLAPPCHCCCFLGAAGGCVKRCAVGRFGVPSHRHLVSWFYRTRPAPSCRRFHETPADPVANAQHRRKNIGATEVFRCTVVMRFLGLCGTTIEIQSFFVLAVVMRFLGFGGTTKDCEHLWNDRKCI